MKIGILTQPLITNYGGILQAFALQTILERMGHNVWIVDRSFKEPTLIHSFASSLKRFIEKYILRKKNIQPVLLSIPTLTERNTIAIQITPFLKLYFPKITSKINNNKDLREIVNLGFDAFVVGSDQVWRPNYSPCITNYFLDFLEDKSNIKRIAYAASFGVDDWEFSTKLTVQCASLAKNFNDISVREDSAVSLCKDRLGVDAIQVLDPTMLLTKYDYIKLVEKDNIPRSEGTLMTYVLDNSVEKNDIILEISNLLGLIPFSVMPIKQFSDAGHKHLEACIFPKVTKWIRGFMDADFVVTDSFHGTVFSIIFNKQFISIGNSGRGLTRFVSLLNIFKLNDRLILSKDELTEEKIRKNIDFDQVNNIWDNEKQKSIKFLFDSLKCV